MIKRIRLTITIQTIATVITAIAVIFSYFAVDTAKEQVRATKKLIITSREQAQASVLIRCLEMYISIQKDRTRALAEQTRQLCFDYYREMFDLHWTEFQLWKKRLIPDHVMKAWLDVRYRNYKDSDSLMFFENGKEQKIIYKEVWDELLSKNYFSTTSSEFIKFMKLTHDGKVDEALKIKKGGEDTK